jgi:ATP-binding cassette, subfamily B, bacterial
MNVTRETIRFYGRAVWRYPRYVIGEAVVIPLTILEYNFLPSLIVANVLSRLSKGEFQPHHLWASFGSDLIAYAVLQLLGGVLAWRIIIWLSWRLEANVIRDIAEHVFKRLNQQSASFHANHFGGSLVSQTNKLMSAYIRIADTTTFQLIPLLASLLWTAIILAHRAPLFVILLLAFSLIYMASSFFVTRKVRHFGAIEATAESEVTGTLADSITNVLAIKAFAGSQHENRRFEQKTRVVRSATHDIMRATTKAETFFSILTSTIAALALFMAVAGVMIFHANIATVFLILTYTANISGQLWTFSSNTLRNYNRALGDASDMIKVLDVELEVKDPAKPEPSRIRQGAITFDKVVFTHDGSADALFHELDLDVKSGEKIGLVGYSGSGKTTLTKLLLRFSDIDGGAIRIDGQDISHIMQDDLRRSIAYVPQEPLLFHRTIRENIAYGKPGATEKEINEAAVKANAADFIKKLPQGYETLVGERGVKLSGGQRQRVAIARAILKDAPILVLDEATSSLDSASEQLIQAALKELMEKRTAIVVAHRLSTIQKMDRIIVLDDGKIVEQGTHTELLRGKGIYAKLWNRQSGGFLEDD